MIVVSSDKDIPLDAFRSSEALQSYNDIVENGTRCLPTELFYRRSIQYYAVGDLEKATFDIQLAISKMEPGFTRDLAKKNLDSWYSKIGKSVPNLLAPKEDADKYYSLGRLYSKMCEYQKAIENLNKAIEIDKGSAKSYLERGISYSLTKEYDLALKDFEIAEQIEPENPRVYMWRGYTYILMNEKEKAKSDLEHALEITKDPDDRKWAEEQLHELRTE